MPEKDTTAKTTLNYWLTYKFGNTRITMEMVLKLDKMSGVYIASTIGRCGGRLYLMGENSLVRVTTSK